MKSKNITRESHFCKSCFKEIRLTPIRSFIEREPILCDDCLSSVIKELASEEMFGIKVISLSRYDGIIKRWLFSYKELGDIELAPCFLFPFLPIIRLFFKRYVFVPLPSLKERSQKRGFIHLNEMLKASGLPFIDVLEKNKGQEQKELSVDERLKKKGIEFSGREEQIKGKNIVLFDDVVTTGSTLKESLDVINSHNPKHVKALILMNNHDSPAKRIK